MPALTRDRLADLNAHYLRLDTIRAANACLIDATGSVGRLRLVLSHRLIHGPGSQIDGAAQLTGLEQRLLNVDLVRADLGRPGGWVVAEGPELPRRGRGVNTLSLIEQLALPIPFAAGVFIKVYEHVTGINEPRDRLVEVLTGLAEGPAHGRVQVLHGALLHFHRIQQLTQGHDEQSGVDLPVRIATLPDSTGTQLGALHPTLSLGHSDGVRVIGRGPPVGRSFLIHPSMIHGGGVFRFSPRPTTGIPRPDGPRGSATALTGAVDGLTHLDITAALSTLGDAITWALRDTAVAQD